MSFCGDSYCFALDVGLWTLDFGPWTSALFPQEPGDVSADGACDNGNAPAELSGARDVYGHVRVVEPV